MHDLLTAPVVVGATGGSGTRVLATVLDRLGVFMGTDLNPAGDAMPFEPALDSFINPVLEQTRNVHFSVDKLPLPMLRRARIAVLTAAARHLRTCPGTAAHWGFKNPRQIFLLPVLADLFPGMRFIHMVRDGRDMALSGNRNQLRQHYGSLFDEPVPDDAERGAIALWQAVNVEASTWAGYSLAGRYLTVRFEDLCAAPTATVERIAAFVAGLDEAIAPDRIAAAAAAVQAPDSLGRWRDLPAGRRDALTRAGRPGLVFFGYHAPAARPTTVPAPLPPVMVLGMHRGGTSATAGVLAKAGGGFGTSLMPATPENPEGYWENEKIVALDRRLLDLQGRRWSDSRPLRDGWHEKPAVAALSAEALDLLRAETAGAAPFVIKDPRLSLLARFWAPLLRRATGRAPRVVLVVRHPLEVARSLAARDGIARDTALWMWIAHMLAAERDSRALARLIVRFEDLVDDTTRTAGAIEAFAGLTDGDDSGTPNARDPGVRRELRHHAADAADAPDGPCLALALHLHRDLLRLADADSRAARAAVTRTRRRVDAALDLVAGLLDQQEGRLRQALADEARSRAMAALYRLQTYRLRDRLSTRTDGSG